MSFPPPPSIVSEVVGIVNSTVSMLGLDATSLSYRSCVGASVIVSSLAVPVTVTSAAVPPMRTGSRPV